MIPFPEGAFEAWNIHLEIEQPDGSFLEPDDVTYLQSGITWKLAPAAWKRLGRGCAIPSWAGTSWNS